MSKKLDKHYLAISTTGAGTTVLLTPGVTVVGGVDVLDKYTRIHLRDIGLTLSAAGVVSFLIGTRIIYKKTFTAAGDVFEEDHDLFIDSDTGDQQALSIVVSGSTNVSGFIRWSFSWAGGNRVARADG